MEELYALYRITRVVLLLSNKYNKSPKVLLELSKERHQALWPNRLLCIATLKVIPWTHPYTPLPTFWDTNLLLFKVLSLLQIDLNMPREESLLQAGCSSTPLCSLSHQHTPQQDLFACAKRTICSSSRGRWLNSKAGSKKLRSWLLGLYTNKTYWILPQGRKERNKGLVPCAAHFRHMLQLSSLAYQSQSLPEYMPGYFYLSIKASSPCPSETLTLLFLSQALC